jgi:WD40 repeat protein
LRSIELGDRAIDGMAISADGRWLAAGDHGSGYTVWDAASGAVQMELKLAHYPASMAFSKDAHRLAIAPMGDAVQIYELATRKKLFELQNPVGGTAAVVFSRDGGRIATADADTVVRVYDARNGELVSRNPDFLLVPLTAAFTADGKGVLAGGGDKVIALVEASTGTAIRRSAKAEDAIAYLETSPDGALVAAVLMHSDNMTLPGPLVISEVATGKTVQEWRPASLMVGGAWTKDGHLLAATMEKKALHVWRVR